jgi:PAS domain S-box-containing protein
LTTQPNIGACAGEPDAVRESERLAVLRRLAVLDTPPEAPFDRIVACAQTLASAPIALITLIDDTRQWFKASRGVGIKQTPRAEALCATAVVFGETLVVGDASLDRRFANNPLVLGEPRIRAYLGAPIYVQGYVLGTVCVLDLMPRIWSSIEIEALEHFAAVTASLLEMRVAQKDAVSLAARLEDLTRSDRCFRTIYEAVSEGVFLLDAEGDIIDANPRAGALLGRPLNALLGARFGGLDWRLQCDAPVLHRVDLILAGNTHTGGPGVVLTTRLPCGEARWFQVNARPLAASGLGQDEGQVVITFADITELKQMELRQAALIDDLRQTQIALSGALGAAALGEGIEAAMASARRLANVFEPG